MKKVIDMDAWKKKHTYKTTKPKKFFFDNYTEEEIKKEVDYTAGNIGAMLEHFQDEQIHPLNTAFGSLHCLFDYILHCAPSKQKGLELIQYILDSHKKN